MSLFFISAIWSTYLFYEQGFVLPFSRGICPFNLVIFPGDLLSDSTVILSRVICVKVIFDMKQDESFYYGDRIRKARIRFQLLFCQREFRTEIYDSFSVFRNL